MISIETMYGQKVVICCVGLCWSLLSIFVVGDKFADIKDNNFDVFKIIKENDVGEVNVTLYTIEQPVDHFDPNNTNKWRMRYFQRHNMFKPGGPIIIFIGGEFSAEPIWISTGICYDIANETHGTLIMSEHRYYGESYPTANKTDFTYFHSRQALADLANLIRYLKSLPVFKNSKVLISGGSYPGMMAVYMKILYPNLIDAVHASSAPVKVLLDNKAYLEHTSKVYRIFGGEQCHRNIRLIFIRYMNLLQTNRGIEVLMKENNICPNVDLTKTLNKLLFIFDKIIEFTKAPKEGVPKDIVEMCTKINQNPYQGVTSAFKSVVNEFSNRRLFSGSESKCNDISLEDRLNNFIGKDYGKFIYQKCNELGLATTTNAEDSVFPHIITENFFFTICRHFYGDYFTPDRIRQNVEKTRRLYEDGIVNASKILFTNGEMDSYSVNGVTESVSENVLSILIPNASHCLDIATISDRDSLSLQEAKKDIKAILLSWIK